MVVSVSD